MPSSPRPLLLAVALVLPSYSKGDDTSERRSSRRSGQPSQPSPSSSSVPSHIEAALRAAAEVAEAAGKRCNEVATYYAPDFKCSQLHGEVEAWSELRHPPVELGPTALGAIPEVVLYQVDCLTMRDDKSEITCSFAPSASPKVWRRYEYRGGRGVDGHRVLAPSVPPEVGEGVVRLNGDHEGYEVRVVRQLSSTAYVVVEAVLRP